jgi:Cu-Zn family superoxide dismutase
VFCFGCADVDSRVGNGNGANGDHRDGKAPGAVAVLRNAAGETVGRAEFSQTDKGVQVTLEASKLTAGTHGFHIHENGTCTPPDFESAGGHFNPSNRQHGFDVQGGPHVGDMRNLDVGDNGQAATERPLEGATLDTSATSLIGRAIVIHEKADDYTSQPAGDAGGRIACGVIQGDSGR